MTWATQAVRYTGFLVVLPAAIVLLPKESVSVWLLFSTVASFQLIFDLGMSPTFARELAYGFVGGSQIADRSFADATGEPDWASIDRSVTAMRWVYRRISAIYGAVLVIAGTWAVHGPIERMQDPVAGWIAWVVVATTSAMVMYGNVYSSVLTGANRIAELKRWEAVTTFASLGLQLLALWLGLGLLGMVIVAQASALAYLIIRRHLANRATLGLLAKARPKTPDHTILVALWPSAWRTAIGALMSYGIAQSVAIAAANLLATHEAVGVQLAIRIMQTVGQVSQVPFYSRLPEIIGLRAKQLIDEMLEKATGSMSTSLFIYVASAIAVDLIARPLLAIAGSDKTLPGHWFWLLLMTAGFFERVGAMHINLLLTGNRSINHIANGVAGLIWVAALFLSWRPLGTMAIPVSMLVANAGFYAPWSAWASHRELGARGGWGLEARNSLLPFLVIVAYAGMIALAT